MNLSDITKIVLSDVKPDFIRVHIPVVAGYGDGGWKDIRKRRPFEDEVKHVFFQHGWRIEEEQNPAFAQTARKDGQYLYLHPSAFEGFVSEEELPDVLNAVRSCRTLKPQTTDNGDIVVYRNDYVYALRDDKLSGLFISHQRDLMALLLSCGINGFYEGDVFEAVKKNKIIRGEDSVYSFSVDRLEYILTMQLVGALVAFGLLSKKTNKFGVDSFKTSAAGKRWLAKQDLASDSATA